MKKAPCIILAEFEFFLLPELRLNNNQEAPVFVMHVYSFGGFVIIIVFAFRICFCYNHVIIVGSGLVVMPHLDNGHFPLFSKNTKHTYLIFPPHEVNTNILVPLIGPLVQG